MESDKMESPKSYSGYDKDNNLIATCTAEDANSYINPEEVKAAIENIKTVCTNKMNEVSSKLQEVVPVAEEALKIQGQTMGPRITKTASEIKSAGSSMTSSIDDLYTASVTVHDKFQRDFNDQARQSVASVANVVRVSP